jgi:uncharacterized integral membrane protein
VKRFLTYLVFVPVAVLVLLFALANREMVTLSLDPFGGGDPTLAVSAPLFIVLFVVLALGVLIGGCAAWLKQGRNRKAARLARTEADRYRAEAERLRSQLAGGAPREPQVALPAPVPF